MFFHGTMDPTINPAKPLRLFELGPDTFQRLCRAVLRELASVKSADIYGVNGQGQRGIDIEVTLDTGRRWAVQCKACEGNLLKHLKAAVEDFRPHIPYWRKAGVDKFIVLVGCGAEDTKVHDAKRDFERELAAADIQFELWDSSEIRRQLRPMHQVVEQFLPTLLSEICGGQSAVSLSAAQSPSVPAISAALIAELGTSHNKRLDEIRDRIRAGDEVFAESELRGLPTSATWEILSPQLKARVYRLLIGIVLNRRADVAEARRLLIHAKEVHPNGRFVVPETVIRHIEEGSAPALADMPDPVDRDEWNLRAALLVNAGSADDAIKLLRAPAFEADAETFRLLALAHLFRREVSQAMAAASEANDRAPDWLLVQHAVGLTEYYSAIAPSFVGWNHWTWPLPVDWHLVRSDSESRAALRRAAERFARISASQGEGSDDWQHTMGWQLACMANDSERQREAEDLAGKIFATNAATVPAVVWALARDYEFPRNEAREALQRLCQNDALTTEPVQALFSLLATGKEFLDAGRLLDNHRQLYQRSGLAEPWLFQRAQTWMAAGEPAEADAVLAQVSDPHLREHTRAALTRIAAMSAGWTQELLAQIAAEAERSGSDDDLFAACEAHHFAGDHQFVMRFADELVRRLKTEPALRLALDAAASAKQYPQCLDLMERYRAVFRDGDFPPEVRRLRCNCLRELGRLVEAEQELRLLAISEASPEDRYQLTQLQLSIGKVTEASTTARGLLDDPRITAEGLFQMAEKLRPDDPDLARTFFNQATQRGVESAAGAALGMQTSVGVCAPGMGRGERSPPFRRLRNAHSTSILRL